MSSKLANMFVFEHTKRPPRIAVMGDVMLDCHVNCEVLGLSPEDETALKLRTEDMKYSPGGAANVAVNLKALGADVALFGLVGNDHSAEILKDQLGSHSVKLSLLSDFKRATTTKTRYMTRRGRHLLRVDSENTKDIDSSLLAQLDDLFTERELSAPFDLVVISDYAKGVVTRDLMSVARKHQHTILVDPKGSDFSKYGDVYAITPNLHELKQAARSIVPLQLECSAHWLVVTKSEEGCEVLSKPSGGSWVNRGALQTNARKHGDPTGCGDSFLAALAYGLALSWPFQRSCRLGNAAGAVSYDFTGAHAVSRSELVSELRSFNYGGDNAEE